MSDSSKRFDGRVAVITGASSGIGAATARELAAGGARLILGDLDEAGGRKLVDELGGATRAVFLRCDVAVQAEVEALIAAADRHFGRLDILHNNAGVGSFHATPDLSPEEWHRVFAINVHSIYYGCHAAIPLMRRQGKGAIVNTASISGRGGDYGMSAYNATKGTVINYTRSMAVDHAAENIRINAVCPGLIATPLVALLDDVGLRAPWEAGIPMRRMGRAEEIAKVVAFLASDDASYVTGAMFVADGGASAHTGQPNIPAALQAAR